MRFRLIPGTDRYEAVKSHKLEPSMGKGGGFQVPGINVSRLMGVPPCPYCANPAVGVCGCDAVMCLPEEPIATVVCPSCEKQISLSDGGGDFTVNQSAG
jgi:hypothetical protein